jgi:hypothetical protein
VTIDKEPDSDKVVCDGKRAITISAIESRCAEINNILASPSNITAQEQKQLKEELDLLKSVNRSSYVRARKKVPAWSSAADLLFDKGLQEASEKARRECEKVLKLHQVAKVAGTEGNAPSLGELKSRRDRFYFEFLARFCETFPECKKQLRYDVARIYCDGPAPGARCFQRFKSNRFASRRPWAFSALISKGMTHYGSCRCLNAQGAWDGLPRKISLIMRVSERF